MKLAAEKLKKEAAQTTRNAKAKTPIRQSRQRAEEQGDRAALPQPASRGVSGYEKARAQIPARTTPEHPLLSAPGTAAMRVFWGGVSPQSGHAHAKRRSCSL
jgi:hypothetical protein